MKKEKKKIVVEYTERGLAVRLLCLCIAVIAAAFAFYTVFAEVLHTQSGWETIEAGSTVSGAGDEFVFQYQIGVSGASASADWTALSRLYPEYLDRAYQVFSSQEYADVNNLYYLNRHPNEAVAIEPELYAALESMDSLGSRYAYYAPVYEQYHAIFGCTNDWETESFDPTENDQVMDYVRQVLAFAGDSGSISLEFLGDSTVCLHVSQAYLDFAQAYEVEDYLDFFYLTNAFVVDSVADQLIAGGYTAGILSSVEGFSRALGGDTYAVTLYDRQGDTVYQAATLEYSGAMSLAFLRAFPLTASDAAFYYVKESGEIRNPFISMDTGLCQTAAESLLVYAGDMGCAELLLRSWDTYVAETLDVSALTAQGIQWVYFADGAAVASDAQAALTN